MVGSEHDRRKAMMAYAKKYFWLWFIGLCLWGAQKLDLISTSTAQLIAGLLVAGIIIEDVREWFEARLRRIEDRISSAIEDRITAAEDQVRRAHRQALEILIEQGQILAILARADDQH
jgi:hypothetical protein